MSDFVPTDGDILGLERLERTIRRDYDKHDGYHVRCFSADEAAWIERKLKGRFPRLADKITVSWTVK